MASARKPTKSSRRSRVDPAPVAPPRVREQPVEVPVASAGSLARRKRYLVDTIQSLGVSPEWIANARVELETLKDVPSLSRAELNRLDG